MDRDTILASFQEISQIQNFEECIQILESVNWDLQLAVDSMDQPTQITTDLTTMEHNFMPFPILNETRHFHANYRELHFNVDIKGKRIAVSIPEDKTVGELALLVAHEINEPNTRLNINGFKTPYNDRTVLRSLKLPSNSNVVANVVDSKNSVSAGSSSNKTPSPKKFHLSIQIFINGEFSQILPLSFDSCDSIGKVKSHLANITCSDIANQKWTGWPCYSSIDSDTTLSESGISEDANNLTVDIRFDHDLAHQSRAEEFRSPTLEISVNNSREIDNEDEEILDDYNYNEDDVELVENDHEMPKKPSAALMDASAHLDPVAAVIRFSSEFNNRYFPPPLSCTSSSRDTNGSSSLMSPPFFLGSMDDALSSTLNLPPRERKPLFLYLHHGESIQANIFCTQILCYSEICLFFMQSDYSIWPWDVTYPENKTQLMSWVTRSLGAYVASSLRLISKDQYPVIVVLSKTQGATEVLDVIDGMRTKEETVSRLWNLRTQFEERLQVDVRAWEERELRDLVKQEQDHAYRESLRLDQQKENERSVADRRLRDSEQLASEEQERSAGERRARVREAGLRVPAEPLEGAETITIRLRAPTTAGTATEAALPAMTRRFLERHTLADLISYIESLGFLTSEFKLLSTYPRKNLTAVADRGVTLKQLGIAKQETLILEVL